MWFRNYLSTHLLLIRLLFCVIEQFYNCMIWLYFRIKDEKRGPILPPKSNFVFIKLVWMHLYDREEVKSLDPTGNWTMNPPSFRLQSSLRCPGKVFILCGTNYIMPSQTETWLTVFSASCLQISYPNFEGWEKCEWRKERHVSLIMHSFWAYFFFLT